MGLFRKRNWNYHGWNKKICSYFDEDGFNIKGYDENGYDKKGYNENGFNQFVLLIQIHDFVHLHHMDAPQDDL